MNGYSILVLLLMLFFAIYGLIHMFLKYGIYNGLVFWQAMIFVVSLVVGILNAYKFFATESIISIWEIWIPESVAAILFVIFCKLGLRKVYRTWVIMFAMMFLTFNDIKDSQQCLDF